MLNQYNESRHVTVQVDASVDLLSQDERKAAAVKAIEALRAHGHAGIEHNLAAAASWRRSPSTITGA